MLEYKGLALDVEEERKQLWYSLGKALNMPPQHSLKAMSHRIAWMVQNNIKNKDDELELVVRHRYTRR